MSSSNYQDPETETKKISMLLAIKRSKSGVDLLRNIDKMYPTWIYDSAPSFDKSLKGFKENWYNVCKRVRTKAKDIVIVDEVVYYEKDGSKGKYSVLLTALDKLTRFGYCIRSKNDLTICKQCQNIAIVAEGVHNWMFEHKKISYSFTGICSECSVIKNPSVLVESSSELSAETVRSIMKRKDTVAPSPSSQDGLV